MLVLSAKETAMTPTTEYAYREPTDYEMSLSVWSDLHKDVYGFRPRHKAPTQEELPAEFARLQKELDCVMAEEHWCKLQAQKSLKLYVRECMKTGMTALAALQEDFRLIGADRMYGWEHYCFERGIGYALGRYLDRREAPLPGPAWGEHED
jgi:hypothetical protein